MPYTINELKSPGLTLHATKVSLAIADKIRGSGSPFDIVFISYLFYKLLNSEDKGLESPYSLEEIASMQWERFISGQIALNPYVLNSLNYRIRRSFIKAYKVYEDVGDNDDTFAAIVMLYDNYLNSGPSRISSEFSVSDSVVSLAQAILDIKNNEEVADIYCGYGDFITKSIDMKPKANYTGYEKDIRCAAILAMKADIMGATPSVFMGDIGYTLSSPNTKYDKIFSNYPLTMRFGYQGFEYRDEIIRSVPFGLSRYARDWSFINVLVDHLSVEGKAVVIAGIGSTWNGMSKDARKYFIENGYIEAVINLPSGIIAGSTAPLVMYVFSHNNKTIRLVDAKDYVTVRDKNYKAFSDEDIINILNLLKNDSEDSLSITMEDAKAKEYSLAFKAYRSRLPKYENGTPLAGISEIIRGTLNPSRDTTDVDTGKYLLQISDLENGSIKKELDEERFTEAEKVRPEQRLLPYDLIITRSAHPVKIAVVSPDEKRELYPNGNMFIVRIKNSNVNPYYLLAFLLSRDGEDALDYASTGNSIKVLSANSLSELVFPLKDASEQRRIAEKITDLMAQYNIYSLKAHLAKERIKSVYYSEED